MSDLAGNMTSLPSGVDPTVTLTAVYDAWNRLVELQQPAGTTLATYSYDGQGRRTSKQIYSGGVPGNTRHFYYSSQWQILEERMNSSTTADRQYVHGLQYVDELCLRDRDTNADGTLDEHLYSLQDANWNVTALVNGSGAVQERYQYDPYGRRTVLDGSWNVLASSGCAWYIGHQGLYLDTESGLYHNRARALHPTLGRFVQRDPLGYVDGMGLYEYERSTPALAQDSDGTYVGKSWDSADPCTLVFDLRVTIYGEHAKDPLPQLWQAAMEAYWPDSFTFKDADTQGICGIRFDFAVTADPASSYFLTASGDNRIYVQGGTSYHRSFVRPLVNGGMWWADANYKTIAHEAGHLMGARDHYHDVTTANGVRSVADKGWEGNLMGVGNAVDARNIEEIMFANYPPHQHDGIPEAYYRRMKRGRK